MLVAKNGKLNYDYYSKNSQNNAEILKKMKIIEIN
jgi:hypothetical protein